MNSAMYFPCTVCCMLEQNTEERCGQW